MVHPDRILDERGIGDLPAVEAVYGLTEGVSSRALESSRRRRLSRCRLCREWQDSAWLARNGFLGFGEALRRLHRLPMPPKPTPRRWRQTLPASGSPCDELLASQLALALVRSRMRRQPGRSNLGDVGLSPS